MTEHTSDKHNDDKDGRRLAQNRRAQQAYRQRREALVAGLEARVALLTQAAQDSKRLIGGLGAKVAQLELENALLKEALGATATATSTPPTSTPVGLLNQIPDWDWLSLYLANIPPPAAGHPRSDGGSDSTLMNSEAAVQLPLPDTTHPISLDMFQSVINQLKSIQHLEDCNTVNEFFRLFVAQSKETNLERIKNEIIALTDVRYKILDKAEIRDRPRVISILQTVWDQHPDHVKRMNDVIDALGARQHAKRLLQPFLRMNPNTIHADVSWFRIGAGHIESLKSQEAVEVVNQLCDCFLQQINLVDPTEQREGFMRMLQLQNRIYSLCVSSEERNLFSLALDIGREHNKNQVNDMLSSLILT